jgi:two-component system response regulator AlgR
LRYRLQRCEQPSAETVAEAGNARELLLALAQQDCDLVLMDIRMPGTDGLQLTEQLRARPHAPAVIFVTAHAEHALQAFDLQAVDYLTKPVSQERLQQALRRVTPRSDAAPPVAVSSATAPPSLVLTDRHQTLRIPVAEIVMLRAADKRVWVTTARETFVTDAALSDLELQLGAGFVRVHRNALVALSAVRELRHQAGEESESGWMLRVVPGDHWLAVSRRQLAAVRVAIAGQDSA